MMFRAIRGNYLLNVWKIEREKVYGRTQTSHPTWVRGLKRFKNKSSYNPRLVAPYVGAWIETSGFRRFYLHDESHPTWVRGLKLPLFLGPNYLPVSHPTWVRGLKPCKPRPRSLLQLSHPTWVRGLKLLCKAHKPEQHLSHPTWVRGLKQQPTGVTVLDRC